LLCKSAACFKRVNGVIKFSEAIDKRKRLLCLTPKGSELERLLTMTQIDQLNAAFKAAGTQSIEGWLEVMRHLNSGQIDA
jgi:hypothetical protein